MKTKLLCLAVMYCLIVAVCIYADCAHHPSAVAAVSEELENGER